MKKFLKILAIILVIIALLAILGGVLKQYANIDLFSKVFTHSATIAGMSGWTWILIGIAGLVLAAIMSPQGFSKALNRVTAGISDVAGGAAKVAGGVLAGIVKGAGEALTSYGWWLLIGGVALWALWPSNETRSVNTANRIALRQADLEERRLALEEKRAEREAQEARENRHAMPSGINNKLINEEV